MKSRLLTFILVLFSAFSLRAQCPPGSDWLVINIVPDNYPNEISWKLMDLSGVLLLSGGSNSDSLCIPSGTCLKFRIQDSYGDGICCGFGQGSYTLLVNGVMIATGGEYDYFEEQYLGCPPGSNCGDAFPAVTDSLFEATGRSTWYEFTPDSTGTYNISTCFPSNTCNTALWVYDHCAGLTFDSTNIGSLFYNDSACGDQAYITAGLQAGITYYIRVGGDYGCVDSTIQWTIEYAGPIVGCMDSTACNFNPLATVSNGNCIYPGDPLCTTGPDLEVDQGAIVNSLSVGTVNGNDACLIGEGCLAGYGVRDVVRFTTTIRNIGDADYYIGPPQTGNTQFVFDQCHGHWHYAGYAAYELYDSLQQPLSVGFKNGFCVLDLSCFSGTAKYGCSNMGISAGCADTYGSGLSCQWLDITDVPAGQYTLVVKVNWDQSPDKLGRVEKTFANNVAYVCINITRNASNVPSISVLPNCTPIIDCLGDTFGLALEDCDGVCNGTRVSGDLDLDTLQTATDIDLYMNGIVNAMSVVRCNDLNSDSLLTVADAALLNGCIRNSNGSHTHPGGTQNTHRHCQFPYDILNITDTVQLGIASVNTNQQYIDVQLLNADCSLLGIDFRMNNVTIDSVVSIFSGFEPLISWNSATGRIAVLDTTETLVAKQLVPAGFLRVYYSSLSASTICIDEIYEAENGDYERTLKGIFNGCITVSGVDVIYNSDLVKVAPNPSNGVYQLRADALQGMNVNLTVTDALGREVFVQQDALSKSGSVQIDLGNLPNGIYLLRLKTKGQTFTNRLVKM